MVHETSDTIEISISDPTQTRTSLTVELEGTVTVKNIVSADEGVDVYSSDNVIQFVVYTNDSYGKTYKAVVSKTEPPDKPVIEEIPKPNPNADIVYVNENFDELYNENDTYIVKQPGNTTSHALLKNGDGSLTFGVSPRSNGSSDGATDIEAYANGTNKYIAAVSGGYASSNRHAYMLFDNMIPFNELDSSRPLTMSFSLYMNPSNDNAVVDFNDGSKSAFVFKTENNKLYISNGSNWQEIGEKNKWYDISITFNADYTGFDLEVIDNGITTYSGIILLKDNTSIVNRVDFGKGISKANYVADLDNLKIVQETKVIVPFTISEEINNDTHICAVVSPSKEYTEDFVLIATHYVNNVKGQKICP